MVPVDVVPSPQLIVAMNSLGDSMAPAWVNVATWPLNVRFLVVTAAETMMAGSANALVALPLLLAVLGSVVALETEAVSLELPSSITWAVTVPVAVPLAGLVP